MSRKRKKVSGKLVLGVVLGALVLGIGTYKFVTWDRTPKGKVVKQVVDSGEAGERRERPLDRERESSEETSETSSEVASSDTKGSSSQKEGSDSSKPHESTGAKDISKLKENHETLIGNMSDDDQLLQTAITRSEDNLTIMFHRMFDYLGSPDNPAVLSEASIPSKYRLNSFFVNPQTAYYMALLLNVTSADGTVYEGDAGGGEIKKAPKLGDKYELIGDIKYTIEGSNYTGNLLPVRVAFEYRCGSVVRSIAFECIMNRNCEVDSVTEVKA